MNNKIDDFIVIIILVLILIPLALITEIITYPSEDRAYVQRKIGLKLMTGKINW